MSFESLIKNAKPVEISKENWLVNLSISKVGKRNAQSFQIFKVISKEEILANINTNHQSGVNLKNAIIKHNLLDKVNFVDYQKSLLYHEWINDDVLFNFSALDLREED